MGTSDLFCLFQIRKLCWLWFEKGTWLPRVSFQTANLFNSCALTLILCAVEKILTHYTSIIIVT